MPLDGNPHPLPGNFHLDNMIFLQPEYPEVGWNVPPVDAMPDVIPHVVNHPTQQEPDGVWEQDVQGSEANSVVSSVSVFEFAPPVVEVMAVDPLEQHGELPDVHVEEEAVPVGLVLEEVLGDQILVDNDVQVDNVVDPVVVAQMAQVLVEEVEVLPPVVDVEVMEQAVDAVPAAVVPPVVATGNMGLQTHVVIAADVSPVVATENTEMTTVVVHGSMDGGLKVVVADQVEVPPDTSPTYR
jgi:hypothetical protein